MKLLVFGRTGQVARALTAQARARGVDLIQCDRQAADLSDPTACAAQIAQTDADAVINAAAWTAVDAAEQTEAQAYVINAEAPGAMARAAALRDLPFVHLSTDYVFPGTPGRPWRPDDKTGPINAYGRTKLAGETAVAAEGGSSVILRTSWVFDGTGMNFVTTMLRLAQSHKTLQIVADQNGGPTPAAAIADACMTIARTLIQNQRPTGIFHFSGTPDINWADFARAIFARCGHDVSVQDVLTSDYATLARRPLNSQLDCGSLDTAFGIKRPDWAAALDQLCKGTQQ